MRQTPHDKNAPRRPSTAFTMFMKERRSASEYLASLPFGERNRLIGNEWHALSDDQKAIYLKNAAEQREAYKSQLAEYKKTDAYKNWLAASERSAPNEAGPRRKGGKRNIGQEDGYTPQLTEPDCKISIFTREFLEYNKLREVILRQLKKQAIQLEEETALLSKHVDNLMNAESRAKLQIDALKQPVSEEEHLLQQLCKELVASLQEVTLPHTTSSEAPTKGVEHITETSVESYLSHLEGFTHSPDHKPLISKATEAIKSAVSKKTLKLLTL